MLRISEYGVTVEMEDAPTDLTTVLQVVEAFAISRALSRNNQSRTEAAKYLGLKRTTLVDKMRRLGFLLHEPNQSPHPAEQSALR